MNKSELYHQCDLSKGTARQTAYIEARGAVVGNRVEINPGSKDFWTVDLVGYPGVPYARVRQVQDHYRESFGSIK